MKYYILSIGDKTFACINEDYPKSYKEAINFWMGVQLMNTCNLKFMIVPEISYIDVKKALELSGKEYV